MNSGLYERAGDSATDMAAAWAKRLDVPMTNRSKVYRTLSVPGAQSEPASGIDVALNPPGSALPVFGARAGVSAGRSGDPGPIADPEAAVPGLSPGPRGATTGSSGRGAVSISRSIPISSPVVSRSVSIRSPP